jgi:predicted  nucleic acid-binding Zn-ribbon protein
MFITYYIICIIYCFYQLFKTYNKRYDAGPTGNSPELDAIMAETQKEEEFLAQKSAEFEALIEERLLTAYKRIRSSVRNGLAVVSIERGASAGSFFTIPPQTQVEIAARKKIITDEHSGRILIDTSLAQEEREKMEKLFSKF